jgi:pectin lyase
MPSVAALGLALVATIATVASAQTVSGKPEGYGSKATGGINGKTVTPTTPAELKAYLESPDPLTVVLSQTFDFRGTEGRTEETGCAPFGTAPSCQLAIDMNGWCGTHPKATVSYDNATIKPIEV